MGCSAVVFLSCGGAVSDGGKSGDGGRDCRLHVNRAPSMSRSRSNERVMVVAPEVLEEVISSIPAIPVTGARAGWPRSKPSWLGPARQVRADADGREVDRRRSDTGKSGRPDAKQAIAPINRLVAMGRARKARKHHVKWGTRL